LSPLPAVAHWFSAGWSVPEGRGPTGAERWITQRAERPVSRDETKKVHRMRCRVVSTGWTNFFRPLDTGRAVCYFRPASGIDRSASWCRFPRRGARSARSIPTGEALPGRHVPERPARPCGLEPADAGGPGTWVGGRGRPRSGRPQAGLEDVEKVLTAIMAGAGGELRGQAGAPTREPFWLDRHDG
jgi:hypothetical protein